MKTVHQERAKRLKKSARAGFEFDRRRNCQIESEQKERQDGRDAEMKNGISQPVTAIKWKATRERQHQRSGDQPQKRAQQPAPQCPAKTQSPSQVCATDDYFTGKEEGKQRPSCRDQQPLQQ